METGNVYRMVELVGSSSESLDAAIHGAIGRASETIENLDWFEVKEIRGQIEEQRIAWFQVKLDVGFRLEDPSG
jgi:flavin-binding protein dodecin